MKISELYCQKEPIISLEVFPPKKQAGEEVIYRALADLQKTQPAFISVTYGAGGSSNANKTLDMAEAIKRDYSIEPLHHLTCAAKTKAEIRQLLQEMDRRGIENILALRGDIVEDAPLGEFHYAHELITYAKKMGNFSVGAACYPEGHISQLDARENIQHLQQKEQAGADFFISQLFFDNTFFYRLVDDARNAGIHTPLIAGVMPIMSRSQVERMIFMCGVSLPSKLIKLIHRYEHNPVDLQKAGLDYALEQVADLQQAGVDGIHIYTMNRPAVAKTVMAACYAGAEK